MIQFIIDLLTPVFEKLGVSPVDVKQYVESLSSYIYAIVGLLALAIVVMAAAHWLVKKGNRHVVRWGAAVSWILAVTVIANAICFGPMYNNLAPILNGRASVSQEAIDASMDMIQEVGEEGMVLTKNNGLLPLDGNSNLNVFGWAATNPIYGGTGSGSADNSDAVDILTSLSDAGFHVNQDLAELYTEYSPTRNLGGPGVSYTDWSLPEPPVASYTDELMENAKEFSDKAMIVLSRSGGEGQDLPKDMNAVIKGTYDIRDEVAGGNEGYNYYDAAYTNNGDYDDFEEGESYLELSRTEEELIEKVCGEFQNVVVVINANNTMELGWTEEYDSIGAVILAPGTGASGMRALGKILNGSVNPSGRTADTYVYNLTDTPTYHNHGGFIYNNVDDLNTAFTKADAAYQGVLSFVNYVEGIYTGYKFYETASEEKFIDYEEKVQYPFGYGLSYTTFKQEMKNFTDQGDKVSFDVIVTNTGDVAGKEVVEVYFTPPYTNGGIEKASVNLIDFAKTQVLEPGAAETVSFELAKEDMAAYDSNKVKTENGGYVLEAGEYVISIRSDSHHILDEENFTLDSDIDYSTNGRASDGIAAVNQFQDYSVGTVNYLSRKDGFANYDVVTAAPLDEMYEMDEERRESIKEKSVAYYDSALYDNPDDNMPAVGAGNGVVVKDLTGKDYDDPLWEQLLDNLSVEDMIDMVNLGGFQTVAVKSIGKIGTQDSDGTSGLNDWYIQVYGTAYPTELLIAQTWNKELAYRVGQDAEACVNDAYLGVWNTIPPKKPDPLLAYVCRIVRNISITRYHANTALKRNSVYDAALDELEDCIGAGSDVEEELSVKELSRLIDRFLYTLNRENRVLFVRRYWYSDSVADIARRMKLSDNSVSVRLSRIRGKLKQYLKKEGYEI